MMAQSIPFEISERNMNNPAFVHLHVHSHYSLLDGACRIGDLARLANENHMKSLALTDHGNLFGVVEFYHTLLKAGVKPIIGYEAYMAPGSRKERHAPGGIKEAAYHLTLLAADIRGYRNLVKLASAAYIEGFYYKPRIDVELLSQHKDGLIVLSGCGSSEICQKLLADRENAANEVAARFRDILGKENFFIELQDNGLAEQKQCLAGLLRIGRDLGLDVVATNDVHYAAPEDAGAHEVLLCINTGKTLTDKNRMRFGSNEFYFKSAQEMIARFGEIPGAVENSLAIADRCNVEMDFHERTFPRYDPPDGSTSDEYLRKLCQKGLAGRYGESSPALQKRLDYELDVIQRMGYSSYFLVVWDIVRFAKNRSIPTGLRGSGASSLVSYVLGISDIDPIRYDLIFERFLDPQRREPPDLDIDLSEERRGEVLRYVKDTYGHDNTAQIITFGTMRARAAVRDVGRVLGWSVSEVEAVAKRIPAQLGVTLRNALEQEDSLRTDYENNPRCRELFDYAFKLEGLARHASTHAAGMVISDHPLTEYIPLCKLNDVVMSQFSMNHLEKTGMLKMDLLGLRTLNIVDKTLDLVETRTGRRPDLSAIALDDPKTFGLLGRGDTKAVFQLGSSGIQELLRRLKPENFEDIIAVVAMYRPGPLQSGMVDDFVARRHGEREITYLDPRLEPILKSTCGVIVYQEQIMRILNQLGGLSLAEALSLIKAISKKRSHAIDARAEAFIKGAKKNGLSERAAEELFSLIRHFAQYGFNRAHATAYAFLAYRTAYLKANYPMEFAAADLTCEMGHTDKLRDHIRDCRKRMGITILPPCINEGLAHFIVSGERVVRFGMAAVRNVGMKAVEAIIRAREEGGRFTSLYDFCERVESAAANRQAIESLIKAGAFDSLPGHRAQKVGALEAAMRLGVRVQQDRRRGQKTLFELGQASGQPLELPLPAVKEWPLPEMSRHEKESLGLRLSFNPLDRHEAVLSQLATASASSLKRAAHGQRVIVAGEIVAMRPMLDRRGRAMAQLELEDLTGSIRGVAFADVFQVHHSLLKEDAIVFLLGSVDRANERVTVRIQDVVPISECRERLATAIKLKLQRTGLDRQILERLRSACERHHGDRPVLLEVIMPDKHCVLIRAGPNVAVRPTEEFSAEVDGLLGEGHVEMVPKGPNGANRVRR